MFTDKFNNLLAVTGLPNNKIARELNLDPSLVSRWRKGTKTPLRNPAYLDEVARLASTRIVSEKQKEVLSKLMGVSASTLDSPQEIQKRIVKWFEIGDESNEKLNESVNRLNVSLKIAEQKSNGGELGEDPTGRVYNDALKKKEAAEHFFLLLENGNTDGTLRILLDGSKRVEKVYANGMELQNIAAAHAKITSVKVLMAGTVSAERIVGLLYALRKVVQNATILFARFNQMGKQMFSHSGIIASGVGAVMSVGFHKSSHAAMVVHTDPDFTDFLAADFDKAYQQSEPMNWASKDLCLLETLKIHSDLHKSGSEVFFCGTVLPLHLLPPEFLEQVAVKLYAKYYDKNMLQNSIRDFCNTSAQLAKAANVVAIIPLFSPKVVAQEGVALPCLPRRIGGKNIITPERYCWILENMLQNMLQNKNLKVHFTDTINTPVAYFVQTSQEIVYMTDENKNIIVRTNHKGVIESLGDFLKRRYRMFSKEKKDRGHQMRILKDRISMFRDYLKKA
ncbi:hypothetical protein LJC56_06065 [Christensenellaceae bacterium OttesenSCG-928-K19]|nr:hypothetical protein [Christensenellaceae bacterium OttesenSCG-928-K19]